tara:strand:- start:720 stop:1514 length:795 start_codon:yes stop_codon:yes gene_type:complete
MKKKFLVIGDPIDHSLSPKLHNYWIKKNNIFAIYEKKQIKENQIRDLLLQVRKKEINGINVTVPFKKKVIPYLDELTLQARDTQSVNTIFLEKGKIIGHNTDIGGFELSLKKIKFNFAGKKILILGAGGVVSSLIYTLNKMQVSKITISNRTIKKAESLRDLFKNISIISWGSISEFDVVINATSIGLNKNDSIDLDLSKVGKNKLFYDVIYNPKETNFLKKGKILGNLTVNGKMMFIYQASLAFKIWHGILPNVDNNVIEMIN